MAEEHVWNRPQAKGALAPRTAAEIATVDEAVAGLGIPKMLLQPGEWVGAVGFTNGQTPPKL